MGADAPPAYVAVDGDTFRAGAEMIRLLGIDAPEHGDLARCDAERMLAELAKDRLQQLLNYQTVSLERHGKDVYGRTLAVIRVRGVDAGALLIRAHLAVKWQGHRHNWCAGPKA